MFKNRIVNIVFYKVSSDANAPKQATIFYQDGTVKTVSFDKGIDACEEICRERNIQTKDAFKEMINRDMVHVVSAKEFMENFNKYVAHPVEETVDEDDKDVEPIEEEEEEEEVKEVPVKEPVYIPPVVPQDNKVVPTDDDLPIDEPEEEEDIEEIEDEEDKKDEHDSGSDSTENDFEEVKDEEEKEKPGFFKRLWNKIKNSSLVRGIVVCACAIGILVGINSCSKRKSLEGWMFRSNLTSPNSNSEEYDEGDNEVVFKASRTTEDRTFTEDAVISSILDRTTNTTQKTAMMNLGTAMDSFNNDFAGYYVEDGKDIRPALKFEEVVALQVAYNDYSKEELQAYFNGADIRAGDLQRAYKDASLQLMGAYAIENSEHPVDMSVLIEDDMGKEFYRTYHELFLKAKEATGEEKIRLVTEFYKAVRRDFPVSQEVRTEGISHSHNYETLEAYKLSVTPMIAAAEMMWQNLDIDVTLDDMEIDFLNDLGLCNYADKSFERAEAIVLSHDADTSNPTYDEYKDAFERYYTRLGTYYIDDEHRELTKLDSFQRAVNWHFESDGWVREGTVVIPGTESHDETYHWSDSEITYTEDVIETPKPITDAAKNEVDQQIAKENEQAKQDAEAAAEAERQRLQQEADQHSHDVEEEVKHDEEDLQNNINQANNQINQNHSDNDPTNDKPVNENDLGHGVHFDREHSDGNGNLNSSVQNITIDPSGDMTYEPLPDPNKTGKGFDAAGDKMSPQGFVEDIVLPGDDGEDEWVESVPVTDDYYYEDAWIEYEDGSYESVVDAYVDSLDGASENEAGYQYHR